MKKWISLLLALLLVGVTAACSDDVSGENGDNIRDGDNNTNQNQQDDTGVADDVDIDDCEPGEILQCAGDHAVLVCNDDGDDVIVEDCPESGPNCFEGQCGDQLCEPGEWQCVDTNTRHQCNSDGTGWEEPLACPDEGVCTGGACETSCLLGAKMVSSYFGCEYWTVYLDQYDDPTTGIGDESVSYAVVISNPNDDPATIQFQSFDIETDVNFPDPVVPPRESRAFPLPRAELDGTGVTRKAIFLRSNIPVTAHQFNPQNNEDIYSNDASLLLPVSTLGTEHYVMNWPSQILPCLSPEFCPDSQRAYITIIAASQGTTNVVVNSTAVIGDGDDMAGFPAGTSRNFELNFGDVLNLSVDSDDFMESDNDLTGTLVNSDQPIALFAGHEQAVVAYDDDRESCCADHIEQQIWPVENLGHRYLAAFSPGRTNTKDHWRILAAENGVTINTTPPQPGADGVTLNAGDFVHFFSDDDFEVTADGPVMVGQFLTGQSQTDEFIGDPAFVLSVPIERFRDEYLVLVPEDYSKDYITILRPAGVEVLLDGSPVTDPFTAIGSGEFEKTAVEVSAGVYELVSDEPFGVLVHGLDNAVSYGYPGGLDVVGSEDD